MASLVPEPIAKCAVCTASPISTTWLPRGLRSHHCAHTTRWKFSQAEPRRWRALLIRGAPPSVSANTRSQKAMDWSWSAWSSPCAFHTASGHSTMKVVVRSSNL